MQKIVDANRVHISSSAKQQIKKIDLTHRSYGP